MLYGGRFVGKKKAEKKNLYSYSKFIHNLLHYEEDRSLLFPFAFYKTRYNDFPGALNYTKSPGNWVVMKAF